MLNKTLGVFILGSQLVPRQLGFQLFSNKFELFPNGLIVHGEPTEDEYDEAFRRLKTIEDATAWWYGDLALGRDKHHGSLKEMAQGLEINYNTLQDYQRVSSKYELYDRSYILSWKHYAVAAPLDDRLEWLKRSEIGEDGKPWSASRLEFEIRTYQKKTQRLLLPPGTFNVVMADPPWQYFDTHMKSWGPTDLHYDSLEVPEIGNYIDSAGIAIRDKFEEDTVLFLWATNPKLRQAFELIDLWEFEYKTNIVWVKQNLKRPGSGYYVRGHHELLFICTRGSIVPNQTNKTPISSVLETNSVMYTDIKDHSQKPEEAYELVEKLYPVDDGYRYLDLFARNHREKWASFGDQIPESP